MMNDFYKTASLKEEPEQLFCTISFNENHPIFQGHFPAQAVVPGVCMVFIVKGLLQNATSRTLLLNRASSVKFLQLLHPASVVDVTVSWKNEADVLVVNARFADAADVFKFSGRFI